MDDVWGDASEAEVLERDRRVAGERLAAVGYHDGMEAAQERALRRCAPVTAAFARAAAHCAFAAGAADAEHALRAGLLRLRAQLPAAEPDAAAAERPEAAGERCRALLGRLARAAASGALPTPEAVAESNLPLLAAEDPFGLCAAGEAPPPDAGAAAAPEPCGAGLLLVNPARREVRLAAEAVQRLRSAAESAPPPAA
eukprot:TRINITY_DN37406_c0_g1_i1.p1 TRINITY_DN37406_c0_g1~~TRINITY_DN37406_c0_g1_i1.p1  ORF type:complete len:223 (+),score=70.22 TRINITY_DN37406_c0_g1_i1:76-669(+)